MSAETPGSISAAPRKSIGRFCRFTAMRGEAAMAEEISGDAERQVDPEGPAPGQILDAETADDGADDCGGRERAGDIGLVSAPFTRGDDIGDRRLRHAV